MTKLKTAVERETSATIFERSKNREVILILVPPNLVGSRLKGTKRTYWLTSDALYALAVKAAVEDERKQRKRRNKK